MRVVKSPTNSKLAILWLFVGNVIGLTATVILWERGTLSYPSGLIPIAALVAMNTITIFNLSSRKTADTGIGVLQDSSRRWTRKSLRLVVFGTLLSALAAVLYREPAYYGGVVLGLGLITYLVIVIRKLNRD